MTRKTDLRLISFKLPARLRSESRRVAEALGLTQSEYMRRAIEEMNRKVLSQLRAERLAEVSRRVRDESMKVNAEFAATEHDPGA